jgi:hypothetical protein
MVLTLPFAVRYLLVHDDYYKCTGTFYFVANAAVDACAEQVQVSAACLFCEAHFHRTRGFCASCMQLGCRSKKFKCPAKGK